MDAALVVSGLRRSYGDTAVLDGVDLRIPRGTITLLRGRSGSGKSTFFRVLAGLERPNAGQVILDGRDLSGLGDDELAEMRLRHLGIVFQSFNLLPALTALENVRLPLDLAGVPRREGQERAKELLSLVGLEGRAEARPAILSGGEQQRVAIARALANRPALLLADEPTGNLDRRNADRVYAMLRELNATLGTTILIITHDDGADGWFDRKLTLQDGRIHEGIVMAPSP